MRLALFGGTFDPIHNAHLEVAREAARRFGLSRVLVVPAAQPPHKSGATAAGYEDRYAMASLACQDEPLFEVSRLEAGNQRSYSIRTIEKLKAMLEPGDELYYLIGADAFAEIRSWHRWQDVIREVEFIVAARPGHDYSVPPGARVHRLDTLSLPVSSSGIRARLAAGESPPEVPPRVLEYIRERGLYQAAGKRSA
ncbi:MAG TPA: nicotinate-nucleotide adenylyltransferase [Bryobacteraceae bacterium]|nr:nicotinate-nucleotide adenylyltransferase [Bryobacteraceae bacterium]HOQ44961.1 nicotinate-nucleotide adenylyltransferase [Bryobacteraceae bacterium]HPU72029.1 nicotinate-nucleotide adenylyltransferase [Bryobacteraceae bacterium]